MVTANVPNVNHLPEPCTASITSAISVGPASDVLQTTAGAERFWTARPELQAVYRVAWRHLVSPWALLGAVLTRSLCAIPYTVRYRSSWRPGGSPLNLMVAMVGSSGAGKSVLDELVTRVVTFSGSEVPPLETPRSGEAIPATIGYTRTEKDEDGIPRTVVEYRRPDHAHRLFWDEVGKLAAQSRRTGSTILEYLKELVSGSTLGGQTAAGDGLVIPGGTYRATVTLSVQPRRAGALVGSAESEGGLSGRIVWLGLHYPAFATDSLIPVDLVPGPITVDASHWDLPPAYIDALPEMEAAHETDRRLGHARQRDDSESHLTLARAIIAIALMNLAGRSALNSQDWELAGLVMEHSAATLTGLLDELAAPDEREEAEQERRDHRMIEAAYARRDAGMAFGKARCRVPYGTSRTRFDQLTEDGVLERW